MSVANWLLLSLRIAHALASTVWLGGGVYYLLALRPATRAADHDGARALTAQAQRSFVEWAHVTTIVMVATGAVLGFDRLAGDAEGLTYAVLLALKVAAAVGAFWLAGVRPRRLAARRKRRATTETIVALGLFAYVVGVALATIYGRGMG